MYMSALTRQHCGAAVHAQRRAAACTVGRSRDHQAQQAARLAGSTLHAPHSLYRLPSLHHSTTDCRIAAVAAQVDPEPTVSYQQRGQNAGAPLRAVVIGAGLAGLTAAHCLADGLFDEVTLLERDQVHGSADGDKTELLNTKRPGVPQFPQPHVLLRRGLNELDALFGDFQAKLVAGGAVPLNWLENTVVFEFGRYVDRQMLDGTGLADQASGVGASRALVEASVRRAAVAANKNLQLLSGARAAGLRISGGLVTGVELADGRHLEVDLVVDASGRGSSTPAWLQAAGYQPPPEVGMSAGMGYGTCVLDIPGYYTQGHEGGIVYFILANPPDNRGGIIFPVEGNKFQVILFGYNNDSPSADYGEFLDFAASLAAPDIYNLLKAGTPLTPVLRYLRTANLRRKYEDITMPEGLCVIGDAVAAFNPVYGQLCQHPGQSRSCIPCEQRGMTVGVMQAVQLRDTLAERVKAAGSSAADRRAALQGLSADFHAKLPSVLEFPWTVATGEDLRRCEKAPQQAPSSPVGRAIDAYFRVMKQLSNDDPVIRLAFWKMAHLLGTPADLFAPGVVARVTRGWAGLQLQRWRKRIGGGSGGGGGDGSGGGSSTAERAAQAAVTTGRDPAVTSAAAAAAAGTTGAVHM